MNDTPYLSDGQPMYLDMQSQPLSRFEANYLLESFTDRVVRQTTVGRYNVTTVNIVINHNFGGPEPIHFETMVYDTGTDKYVDELTQRSATFDEAVADFHHAVTQLKHGGAATGKYDNIAARAGRFAFLKLAAAMRKWGWLKGP